MSRSSSITATFWGVRGSIPSPGTDTARYGGNTACVTLNVDSHKLLVLDAGTGIRQLGKHAMTNQAEIFMLLSHSHWDHIQGFPFFQPLYQPERPIYVFPDSQGHPLLCASLEQMDGAHFPVKAEALPSRVQCVTGCQQSFLKRHGFQVQQIAINHPGGGTGYRLEHANKAIVYLTDNELDPPYAKNSSFGDFVTFCQDADILIHDAQYLESDMPAKHGWGHSLVTQVWQLAVTARVKHLVLFHHDPDRSDDELDQVQERSQTWFRKEAPHILCSVAFEGMSLQT